MKPARVQTSTKQRISISFYDGNVQVIHSVAFAPNCAALTLGIESGVEVEEGESRK